MKIGRNHGVTLPDQLSRFQDKLDLYATDTYFLESWEDLLAVAGNQSLASLSRFASLTLKPDAVVGRTLKPTMKWLVDHGFSIVAAELVYFDRHITRGIWHYSWNVASRDRKDVVDMLLPATPSLFLALRGPEDASLWLSANKGPANPKYRQPGQLRYGLGYFSTLLNFVHTSDEPADVIRELAVYFPAPTRRRIYQAMNSGDALQHAEDLASELEDRFLPHDLALDASIERIRVLVDAGQNGGSRDRTALRSHLDEIANGGTRDWKTLFSLLEAVGVPCEPWDLIVVATNLVQIDNPDVDPMLPAISSLNLPTAATEIEIATAKGGAATELQRAPTRG
ncbi:MAG: nucleoside-diphosphate kinase [Solirubrobacterales bacterium]